MNDIKSPRILLSNIKFAGTEITYPLGLWLAASILLDICASREGIQPPDAIIIQTERMGFLRLAIRKDGYVCSVKVEDDTDVLDAPVFRSGCHALLDAYESRAQGEPPTAGSIHRDR